MSDRALDRTTALPADGPPAASAPAAAPPAPAAGPPAPAAAPPAPAAPPLVAPDPSELRLAVLAWYDRTGRSLPFRGVTDPWAILVSEAMAQQTQAARAGEAWRSFMATYPTPAALAAATPAEVLRAWRGLGYNRRAVALRRAAIAIVTEHGGRVPDDLDALQRLPGVGPYTARAVAALAFSRRVGAVDTNVRRVLTRLAPDATTSPRALQLLADALVDPARPGDWTHALMDLGARICRASTPDCPACPLAGWCATARQRAIRGRAADERAARPTVRERPAPFLATRRWLRGRLVERLRDAGDGEWVRLEGSIGGHPEAAVEAAIVALERDGLVERHPAEPALVRLPMAAPSQGGAR